MTFRVEDLRHILGSRLAHLWLSDQARGRAITCVTWIESATDTADAQTGELMIVPPGLVPGSQVLSILEQASPSPAVLLLKTVGLSDAEIRRIHALAAGGAVGVAVLTNTSDPRALLNPLSRAVASSFGAADSARLHSAQTLQSLAESLGLLLGNSVTIESPAHEVLANSPAGADVDQHRIDTILRRKAGAHIMEHPGLKRFLSQVRAHDWPQHLEAQPELGHTGRVAMRIAADGELYGIIWVTDTARPLVEHDYAAIRQAADVAAALFTRSALASRREAMVRADVIEDVVTGRIVDPENVRTVALTVGWNVDRLQQAIIVSIDNFEEFRLRQAGKTGAGWRREQDRLMELVKLEVLAVDPAAVVGLRSSSVVILLDVGVESGAERKAAAMSLAETIVRRSTAFLSDLRVTVGVGRDFPSLEGLAESFRQAALAAELGQRLWGGNRAIHYDDLGIHRVLLALREHEGAVPPALQHIIAHDNEHGTDYVHTLAAYLRHMGRLRTAAAELGIHRNTLEYRIGRIAQLAGVDVEDADNRLSLELGIRLLELERDGAQWTARGRT